MPQNYQLGKGEATGTENFGSQKEHDWVCRGERPPSELQRKNEFIRKPARQPDSKEKTTDRFARVQCAESIRVDLGLVHEHVLRNCSTQGQ